MRKEWSFNISEEWENRPGGGGGAFPHIFEDTIMQCPSSIRYVFFEKILGFQFDYFN